MASTVCTKLWKSFDWALCKTAGITFDTIQYFNKRNPNPFVHAEMVGQAAAEVLGEDQAHARLAAQDRFALPGLRARKRAKPSSPARRTGAT